MRGARKIETMLRRVFRRTDLNLVFVHVPKCGGTSLHDAITRYYSKPKVTRLLSRSSRLAADRAGRDLLSYRRDLLIYELERGGSGRFLSGHWPLDAGLCETYRSKWSFVGLLRNPVDRWLSHYFYNASADSPFRIEEPIDAFLETPRARLLGSVYVRQLNGGAIGEQDEIRDDTIQSACRTLNALDLVGTLEQLELFRSGFRRRFGLGLNIGFERPGESSRLSTVTDEHRRRITELCHADLRVYNDASTLATGRHRAR